MAESLRELRTRIRVPKKGRNGTKKLSQNEVATIVGVHVMSVWKWESGHAAPHPDCRPLYAKVLGVTETELERSIEETLAHGYQSQPDTAQPIDRWTEIVLIKTKRPTTHPDADNWRVGTMLSVRGDEGRFAFETYYEACGFEILEEKLWEEPYGHEIEPKAGMGQNLEPATSH